MSKQAMELALEALEDAQLDASMAKSDVSKHIKAIQALRQALAEQPAQRKRLTNEEFLELILRQGTQELVGLTTYVGESIQMQGRIGLLHSAKLIKEFLEKHYDII